MKNNIIDSNSSKKIPKILDFICLFLLPSATLVTTIFFGLQIKKLNEIEIGPTLAVSDVAFEVYDANNVLQRKTSFVFGDLISPKPVINSKNRLISIKFKNTGKSPAMIWVNKIITPSFEIFPSSLTTTTPLEFRKKFLLAGNSETSWMLRIQPDVKDYCDPSKKDFLKYIYNLNYSSYENQKDIKSLNFVLLCNFHSQCEAKDKTLSIKNISPECLITE